MFSDFGGDENIQLNVNGVTVSSQHLKEHIPKKKMSTNQAQYMNNLVGKFSSIESDRPIIMVYT